jgi:hypothetical protein
LFGLQEEGLLSKALGMAAPRLDAVLGQQYEIVEIDSLILSLRR